jgi:glycosyltransferase involved in cell wall biosynthesis
MADLIVADWLERHGGSEQVIKQFLKVLPEAKLFALWNSSSEFNSHQVKESWLASTPLSKRKALAVPFMIPTFKRIELDNDVDRLIVSTHSFAHHAQLKHQKKDFQRYSYVHTPARYIWDPELDRRGWGLMQGVGAKLFQKADRLSPARLGKVATNSRFVASRVRDTWGIEDVEVIYPPVRAVSLSQTKVGVADLSVAEIDLLSGLPDDYVLSTGRLVEYKRHDLAIRVAHVLGLPVVIAGGGADRQRLESLANAQKVPIHLVETPSDEFLKNLITGSSLCVFAGVEDFGIMTVEAMALGAKLLVSSEGGSSEIVRNGVSGVWTDFESSESIRYSANEAQKLDVEEIKKSSLRFDESVFRSKFEHWIGPSE